MAGGSVVIADWLYGVAGSWRVAEGLDQDRQWVAGSGWLVGWWQAGGAAGLTHHTPSPPRAWRRRRRRDSTSGGEGGAASQGTAAGGILWARPPAAFISVFVFTFFLSFVLLLPRLGTV